MLLALFLASGLVMSALSIPLIRRKIPPNGLYGFRIRKTMENPDIWYPANRYAGKWLFGSGICISLAAIALRFVPGFSLDAYALGELIIVVATLSTTVVMSFRFLLLLA
jgi:hypothetical protein